MERLKILLVVILILCCGCTSVVNSNQNQVQNEGDIASLNYNISTIVYDKENAKIKVEYPQIDGQMPHLQNINDIIKQELKEQLEIIAANNFENLDIQVRFTSTFKSNSLVCFLFEGKIYRDGAAHPINVGFSICISLKETKIVAPKAFIKVESALAKEFLSQLEKQPVDSRFSENEWGQVVEYIKQHSNAEILHIMQSEECVFALGDSNLVVLFPLPHAVGDYLKVSIPYNWNVAGLSN